MSNILEYVACHGRCLVPPWVAQLALLASLVAVTTSCATEAAHQGRRAGAEPAGVHIEPLSDADHPPEVDIPFRPPGRVELVYRITESSNLLDATGARRTERAELSRVISVVAVSDVTYDIRMTEDGTGLPVKIRVSRRGVLHEVVHDPVRLPAFVMGVAAGRIQGWWGLISVAYSGSWRRQEHRPLMVRPPGPGGTIDGHATFWRLVRVNGRLAAEFDFTMIVRSPELPLLGAGPFEARGKYWIDLGTGLLLLKMAESRGKRAIEEGTLSFEGVQHEVLVLAESSPF